jgi:hypothetical protein
MWEHLMSCPEVRAGLKRLEFAANRRHEVTL